MRPFIWCVLLLAGASLRAQELPEVLRIQLPAPAPKAMKLKPGITITQVPATVLVPVKPIPVPASRNWALQEENGRQLVAWLTGRLWIREATGRNDGAAVAALVKAGGGVPAQHPEWCGFTQAANQLAHGLPIPKNGMQGAARAWFLPVTARTCYLPNRLGSLDSIRVGFLVGMDYGRGIHHVTRVAEISPPLRKGRPPRGFFCMGGNEGRGTNAGIHRTFYPGPNIAGSANWNYK